MPGQNNQQYSKVSTDSEDSSDLLIEKPAFLDSPRRGFGYALQKGGIIGAIITCSILALGVSFAAGRASVGMTECGKKLSPWCKTSALIHRDEQCATIQ